MNGPKWWFYTVEIAPVGSHGPFGPFGAADRPTAVIIGDARARSSGLTLDRIELTSGSAMAERTDPDGGMDGPDGY